MPCSAYARLATIIATPRPRWNGKQDRYGNHPVSELAKIHKTPRTEPEETERYKEDHLLLCLG